MQLTFNLFFGTLWKPLLLHILVASFVRAVSFQSTGSTVILGNIPYFVPPFSVGLIGFDSLSSQVLSVNGLIPITIAGDASRASQLVQDFTNSDDVFSEGFLQGIIPCLSFELAISCRIEGFFFQNNAIRPYGVEPISFAMSLVMSRTFFAASSLLCHTFLQSPVGRR